MISPLSAALILLWSGLAAADQRALGGRQIHQPLVAAVVAGLILGDPQRGLLVGAWFQLIWSVPLPVGGAILPDTGSTAVAATVLAVLLPFEAGLLLAILLGLFVAYGSLCWERRLRARNQSAFEAALRRAEGPLGRIVLAGLLAPFARGVLVAAGSIACGIGIGIGLAQRNPSPGLESFGDGIGVALIGGAAAVGFASLVDRVRIEAGSRAWGWILSGLVLGITLRWVVGLRS